MDDGRENFAGNPVIWAKSDFRKWIQLPRVTATQTPVTQNPPNTTNTTPPFTTKLEDDALLNWRKSC